MSTLFLVSTPIGNLADLSPRAAEVLRSSARILAEDTRRTRILADHVGSTAPMVALHAHNERERARTVLGWLDAGEDLALVSDAGTPVVSDPGARLVSEVIGAGHEVVPIPGPSAVLAALVASGLPAERFVFLGFPERKGPERRAFVERVVESRETVVAFESPLRLVRLLRELADACGASRRVAVARELTKLHESFFRGTLGEAAAYYEETPARGEVTLVIEPSKETPAEAPDAEEARAMAARLLEGGMRPSAAARELTRRLALNRNDAYRIVHDLDPESPS